jgi:hypothetical protein
MVVLVLVLEPEPELGKVLVLVQEDLLRVDLRSHLLFLF